MKIQNNRIIALSLAFMVALSGCGREEGSSTTGVTGKALPTVEVAEGEPLVYLDVVDAEASSFDQTPDWAPAPDPMAPVDGDMLTRWSSDYISEDQWIFFDLESEKVVSNVIVRWERACSKVYKILISSDGENWQEVFTEGGGKPGAVESSFPPVKCRYLKIQNVEKANEDWGISMWEVEIYGPGSHNPGAEVTRNEYLTETDDTAKKEEAGKLVEKNSSEVIPLSERPFQKGVVYTSWMAEELELPVSDITLVELKKAGYDSVAIMVPK